MRIAALDVGGTAIKSAVWENEKLTGLSERPTSAGSAGALMDELTALLRAMPDLDGVGVSTRGQVDGSGTILFDNGPIPDYTGTPVKALLEQALSLPVFVENDVNCAAWAEARLGAGRGYDDFLSVTYGTGVGGAIVQNGRLYRGANFSAGEFGGMQLFSQQPQGDGLCAAFYENLASASALVREAQAILPEIQDGRQVCQNLDRLAPAVDRWVRNVSYGLSSLIHIFNPALVVLGGGILQNQTLFEKIDRCTHSQLMPGFELVRLSPARLGNQAGMTGAALLAMEAAQN